MVDFSIKVGQTAVSGGTVVITDKTTSDQIIANRADFEQKMVSGAPSFKPSDLTVDALGRVNIANADIAAKLSGGETHDNFACPSGPGNIFCG